MGLKKFPVGHSVHLPNQTFLSVAKSKKRDEKEVKIEPSPLTNISIVNDIEFMSINVKKSDKYHESQNPYIGCYYAKSKKRGICLFFNNIEYENNIEEKREGAEVDQKNLEELFNQIGIEFRPFVNNTKKMFEDTLDEFVKSPQLKGVDCVFIIVSSHGHVDSENNEFIKCCDGDKILDKDIIGKFNNTNCPTLRLIPKIFVFQKCSRDENLNFGYSPALDGVFLENLSLSERTQLDGKESNLIMNTFSDILIVYSIKLDFVTFRGTRHGSWYFIAMCDVFMKHAHNMHIMDLFAIVDQELMMIDFKKNAIQTSYITSFGFNRHLFLNPGYFGN